MPITFSIFCCAYVLQKAKQFAVSKKTKLILISFALLNIEFAEHEGNALVNCINP